MNAPHRREKRPGALWLIIVATLATPGCILHGPGDVKRELSSAAGVELDREMGLTVGRFGTWIAKKAVRASGEVDFNLKGVHNVQVGVYEVAGLRPGYENRRPLTMDHFSDKWTPIVRVHEPGEDLFVLSHEDDGGTMRSMLVVVAEADEWVIVRLKGNLNQVIEEAMRMALSEIDRPDLYEAARRERGLEPETQAAEPEPDAAAVDASSGPMTADRVD